MFAGCPPLTTRTAPHAPAADDTPHSAVRRPSSRPAPSPDHRGRVLPPEPPDGRAPWRGEGRSGWQQAAITRSRPQSSRPSTSYRRARHRRRPARPRRRTRPGPSSGPPIVARGQPDRAALVGSGRLARRPPVIPARRGARRAAGGGHAAREPVCHAPRAAGPATPPLRAPPGPPTGRPGSVVRTAGTLERRVARAESACRLLEWGWCCLDSDPSPLERAPAPVECELSLLDSDPSPLDRACRRREFVIAVLHSRCREVISRVQTTTSAVEDDCCC
jgi:hypothetical protein